MTSLNQLKSLKQPKFVLIKDLETPYMVFDTVDDFIAGEVICITDTLIEAESQIPEFTFPSDPDKQELYREIFEDSEDMVAGDALKYVGSNLPWAIIDPEDCPFDSGKVVFGVTYTVVCVYPPDKKIVLENIIKQIQDLVKVNKSSLGMELNHIWDDVLERIIFIPRNNTDYDRLRYDIKTDLEKRINQLPNAPKQADWDYLEEMCIK